MRPDPDWRVAAIDAPAVKPLPATLLVPCGVPLTNALTGRRNQRRALGWTATVETAVADGPGGEEPAATTRTAGGRGADRRGGRPWLTLSPVCRSPLGAVRGYYQPSGAGRSQQRRFLPGVTPADARLTRVLPRTTPSATRRRRRSASALRADRSPGRWHGRTVYVAGGAASDAEATVSRRRELRGRPGPVASPCGGGASTLAVSMACAASPVHDDHFDRTSTSNLSNGREKDSGQGVPAPRSVRAGTREGPPSEQRLCATDRLPRPPVLHGSCSRRSLSAGRGAP